MSNWRITYHWAASGYTITPQIRKAYHFIIGPEGELYTGVYKPEANKPIPIPLTLRSNYAQHCGGENSWNIGVCLLGMAGYVDPYHTGRFPLTSTQFEKACHLGAQLAMQYGISIRDTHIRTHYEVGQDHKREGRKSPSIGKIDITYLPFKPELKANEVGGYIRNKVLWYFNQINKL